MRAAYYALHYGKEYLAWSIRSVQDAVDGIYIFYSGEPSYGFSAGAACPDSRDALEREAQRFARKPIYWIDGEWHSEHAHREFALSYLQVRGAQQVLVVDADEVWPEGHAQKALDIALAMDGPYIYSAGFHNFWRSFSWRLHDGFRPIRVVDLRHRPETINGTLHPMALPDDLFVLHFGYAQSEATMRYKWTCHGHQRELREGWIDRFCQWQPGDRDLHPVVNNLWDMAHPAPEIDRQEISRVLADHPYYGLPLIR